MGRNDLIAADVTDTMYAVGDRERTGGDRERHI